MGQAVMARITAKSRLATMVAAAPLLAPHMALYSNALDPSPTTVLADLTEATFGGYARQAPVFAAPVYDQAGTPVAPTGAIVFTCDGTSSGSAYGWYLLDSTGALVAAGKLDGGPLNFVANGDAAILFLLFGLAQGTLTVAQGP